MRVAPARVPMLERVVVVVGAIVRVSSLEPPSRNPSDFGNVWEGASLTFARVH